MRKRDASAPLPQLAYPMMAHDAKRHRLIFVGQSSPGTGEWEATWR